MQSKIISLNVSSPQVMHWQGREVLSSMQKKPIEGDLIVNQFNIEGDSFQSPEYHGTPDSVLYAFGLTSVHIYMKLLGRDDTYTPGTLGENLTLSELDESSIFVGDVFSIGNTLVQATFPRIPCGKVNIRMQHKDGQRHLIESGRSGIYFRVLKPGQISFSDTFKLYEKNLLPTISIFELYKIAMQKEKLQKSQVVRLLAIETLPKSYLEKLKKIDLN